MRKKQILLMASVGEASMPETLMDEIIYFDNGDWNDAAIYHYCFPGCRCGRTLDGAKSKTRSAILHRRIRLAHLL